MAAWNADLKAPASANHIKLNFGAFVFNQFHERDDTNCADIADNNCDNTVKCAAGGRPAAGFLLMNSIVGIHRVSVLHFLSPWVSPLAHFTTVNG